ncbi:MAG TPA: 30S ribosome-binding factor RbfA [Stellaceae bacterium]|nr:30S ribosome-binding factor RbfA [Stellaceae bacterium]
MARTARPKTGQRPLRVGEELRHALARVFERGELHDPDLAGATVTVTEVRVSPDLRRATAYVMPLGGARQAEVMVALRRSAPFLRRAIGRSVTLRLVPDLAFELDTAFDHAHSISAALRRPEVERDLAPGADDGDGDDAC